ncbi:TonB-dependent receptor domain-containing protein [Sphingomonas sp. Leaf25]|uniref:TonB-dependent receptor domain-containing protein n=1 Tax=Sphingomonas sp. Leaf25 TaxID=1735692 RepID=UPI0009EC602E|nr:TonB-dependent receptor [Sphingomonas sp. Leaf25]
MALAQALPVADDKATVDDKAGEQGEILVTGSRIRRIAADSPSPVAVVDADQIRATGATQIADVINQLPALAVTLTNQTSNRTGNAGVNALDLRGMGTQRTLVLIDGRRQVPSVPGTSAVDLSNLPASLIQRVEVVTGGASALYGADAVAGVANFITKRDFHGVDANLRYGASTRGDLDIYSMDLTAGRNFADGRGNVTLYGFYEQQPGSVTGADRPWTAGGYPFYTRANANQKYYISDDNQNIYSSDSPQVVLGGKLYAINPNGTLRAPQLGSQGFTNAVPVTVSNTNSEALGTLVTNSGGEYHGRYDGWYLAVPSERFSTRFSGNFEVSPALKLFALASLSQNRSEAAYAPLTAFGSNSVPRDSPFITPAILAANGGALPANGLYFARRMMELGTPSTLYRRQTFQSAFGAEGDFRLLAHDWNYSTYYSYGVTEQQVRRINNTSNRRWTLGLNSTTGANGQAVCRSTLTAPGNGCVAINPLLPLTQQMIDYVQYSSSWSRSVMKQQVASGYVSGGLFDLPGGSVEAVIGAEYRKESNDIGVSDEFNPKNARYDPTLGITATPLLGKYDVKEAYGELHVPLLKDVPGFRSLSVDGAVRLSDYSTAGNTTTYKVGGEWAPFRDIRFRATYGKAVRAPNIGELYTASSIGGMWITDPCQTWNLANRVDKTQYTPKNCATINPGDRNTYWVYRDIISKGNLDLKPETARTLTVGTVLQPRFIPGLSLTVDYFNIDLRDSIDAFPAQTLINKCVDQPTLTNIFCPLIQRDANNNLLSVVTQKLNLAKYLTRGIDFGLQYATALDRLGIAGVSGRLSVDANYTRLLKREYTLDPTDPTTTTEYRGVFGSPTWKGVVRTAYTADSWGANWTLRHFSPMRTSPSVTSALYEKRYTPDVFYNDFSAWVRLLPGVDLSGGLNNAFDRKPPRIPGAEAGGANFELANQAGVYDVIGRTFFVGARIHY